MLCLRTFLYGYFGMDFSDLSRLVTVPSLIQVSKFINLSLKQTDWLKTEKKILKDLITRPDYHCCLCCILSFLLSLRLMYLIYCLTIEKM